MKKLNLEGIEFSDNPEDGGFRIWLSKDEVNHLVCKICAGNEMRLLHWLEKKNRVEEILTQPKKCPYCAHDIVEVKKITFGMKDFYCVCSNCKARGPESFERELAVERWDTISGYKELSDKVTGHSVDNQPFQEKDPQ